MPVQQFLEPEQDPRPPEGRCGRPGGKRGGGGGNRFLHFVLAGERNAAAHFSGSRVVDVSETTAGTGNALAVDEMTDGFRDRGFQCDTSSSWSRAKTVGCFAIIALIPGKEQGFAPFFGGILRIQ
jgi:hypothetical protein